MKRAWQEAAERGDAAALHSAIDEGEDIDSLDTHGQTALMIVAVNGHLEAARVLIEAGADLDQTAKFRLSALMLATINVHDSIVKLLVEAGANTGITGRGAPGFDGKTALDLANELGKASIARLLDPGI